MYILFHPQILHTRHYDSRFALSVENDLCDVIAFSTALIL